MNKIKLSLLEWGSSGFRNYRTIREARTGGVGIDLEVERPDGSSTTLRITIETNGDVPLAEPVRWSAPEHRYRTKVRPEENSG